MKPGSRFGVIKEHIYKQIHLYKNILIYYIIYLIFIGYTGPQFGWVSPKFTVYKFWL